MMKQRDNRTSAPTVVDPSLEAVHETLFMEDPSVYRHVISYVSGHRPPDTFHSPHTQRISLIVVAKWGIFDSTIHHSFPDPSKLPRALLILAYTSTITRITRQRASRGTRRGCNRRRWHRRNTSGVVGVYTGGPGLGAGVVGAGV